MILIFLYTKQLEDFVKNNILKHIRGRAFQPLWEKLFHYSKIGMNFWGGASLLQSGEKYALLHANKKLNNKMGNIILFDVGAYYGDYALLALKIFTKKIKIFSFEPSSFAFTILNQTIQEKRLQKIICTFNFGYGASNEKLILNTSGIGASIASVYNLKNPNNKFKDELRQEIIIKTIDEFCLENNINQIDYLKIDVEGHEFQVLLGAKKMIENRKINFIQFEFGECHIDSRTFFRDFYYYLTPNYQIYRIVSNGLISIKNYSTELEVFDTINYLAELKVNV